MPDASDAAPVANKKPKTSKREKLAAREAKETEKSKARKAERTEKKADGWERKGRDSNGQKVYDFNSNTANGSFVAFDENTVNASRRVKGAYKEEIARDMDTGNAARSRSWAGGIKRKTEYTEERVDKETGQLEDVRTRKEKQNFAASKNVDYKENGAKTIERGTRKGMFSITYTNNPDGSRSFSGFKIGPFKINRSKGENGAKSFEVSFGKSLSYSTLTEANGNRTRNYNIGNIYANSTTVNSKGELVRSEKTYFGRRTKTIENTADGSTKYTTKGRSVNEMKRDGLDENQITDAINEDIAAGKVYRLKRTNERGEITRDYNRQTYKGKTSDYIAGDRDTNDVSRKSSGWGLSKTSSQTLSSEQRAARNERQEQLELESITSSTPGAFPSDLSPADRRMNRNASASSKAAQVKGVADAKGTDAKSVSSAASDKSSIASFATAAGNSVRSMVSGKGSIDSSATSKTAHSDASYSSTATTATANSQTKLQAKLDERSRGREAPSVSME